MATLTVSLVLTMRDIPNDIERPSTVVLNAIERLNDAMLALAMDPDGDCPQFANASIEATEDGNFSID